MKVLVLLNDSTHDAIILAKAVEINGKDNVHALSLYNNQEVQRNLLTEAFLANYYGVTWDLIAVNTDLDVLSVHTQAILYANKNNFDVVMSGEYRNTALLDTFKVMAGFYDINLQFVFVGLSKRLADWHRELKTPISISAYASVYLKPTQIAATKENFIAKVLKLENESNRFNVDMLSLLSKLGLV